MIAERREYKATYDTEGGEKAELTIITLALIETDRWGDSEFLVELVTHVGTSGWSVFQAYPFVTGIVMDTLFKDVAKVLESENFRNIVIDSDYKVISSW